MVANRSSVVQPSRVHNDSNVHIQLVITRAVPVLTILHTAYYRVHQNLLLKRGGEGEGKIGQKEGLEDAFLIIYEKKVRVQ